MKETIRRLCGIAAGGLAILVLAGCGGGGGGSSSGGTPDGSGDFVTIESVAPANATADSLTTFTVKVRYRLEASAEGDLMVGFNDDQATPEFQIKDTVVIGAGAGVHEFVVDATPIIRADGDPFGVYANISSLPHGEAWMPLDSDVVAIPVTASGAAAARATNCAADGEGAVRCGVSAR